MKGSKLAILMATPRKRQKTKKTNFSESLCLEAFAETICKKKNPRHTKMPWILTVFLAILI